MPGPSLAERLLVFYGAHLPNHPRKWWLHDRLRSALGVKPGGEREVVREGFRWSLDPSDYEHAGYFWLGSKDPWDIHHILKLVPRDAVILDIGANFGYYSVRLAKELGPDCRIHAFEPNPKTNARLRKHLAWNELDARVTVHALGVSDQSGEALMVERPDNSGAARIGQPGESGVSIKITSLDDFVQAEKLERVDLMKIDVEGLEEKLIAGASAMIERFRPIIVIELWPPGLRVAGTSVEAVVDRIKAHRYDFFQPKREVMEPVTRFPDGVDPINVFCIPQR